MTGRKCGTGVLGRELEALQAGGGRLIALPANRAFFSKRPPYTPERCTFRKNPGADSLTAQRGSG